MFIPPSFEPNSPREQQWFPRPITDSIESKLDLLERLEEDRRRRLRAIANVAARTPIGLGGVEDRGHGGSAGNLSPKPSAPGSNNAYQRHRYYPPPSESSASLHASYQRGERFVTTTPASVTTRRARRTPRSTAFSSAVAAGMSSSTPDGTRDGARTPVDGIGTATPGANDRAYMEDTRDASSFHRRGNRSVRSSVSSAAFMSPPLDPRDGGGAGRGNWGACSPHIRRQSTEGGGISISFNVDTAVTPMAGDQEYVTPPAMSTEQTPHGRGEDLYSQRRVVSQRRRRRGWDEVNI